MSNTVKIACTVSSDAVIPVYQTSGAAGADICACITDPLVILPGCRSLIPTGLAFSIPEGYEIQIRPRSGLAVKNGITCLNTPGTIDSDYRGEVKVLLINTGLDPFTVHPGDRIAQLIVAPVTQGCFYTVSQLDETARGAGGFGSTGVTGSAT
jgi:dUTP pyrophosphatase